MDWMELKGVTAEIGLAKDALHVYGAFIIQLAAAFAMRRSLASWLPWLAVLGALMINEYLDIFHGEEAEPQWWQIQGSIHDAINTMVLPTALLILARVKPALFAEPAMEAEETDGGSETDAPEQETADDR